MSRVDNIPPQRLLACSILASIVPFVFVALFRTGLYRVMETAGYLVFHNVVEFFSVMVSFSIFGLGWYAYDQNKDRHSLFLSSAFLAIGLMDFMHTLGYSGMPPLVTPNTPNKATLFWVAVRFFSATAFLASAFISSTSGWRLLSKYVLMTAALAVSAAVFCAVIFFPEQLPAAFIPGSGLTPFKMYAEYLIILVMVLACGAYWRRLSRTGDLLFNYYLLAFVLCIFSELAFTLYKSAFDSYNMLGHLYKTAAFMLIYKGIFVASVRKPYDELIASAEALRQNRNMLSHIINSIPQSIFWKDRESRYLGCNQVFARQAGLRGPVDIVGKTDYDLPWSANETDGYRADDREVMQQARAKFHIIETQLQADGNTVWIDTTKIPLTDGSGAVCGVLGVYEDITTRKKAEEDLKAALLFNQQIINSAQEGIIVHDHELRYRLWNPFMEQMTGLKAADVIGKTPLEAFPFLNVSALMESLTKVINGENVEAGELAFEDPNTGRSGWLCYTCAPIMNATGEIIGVIRMNRDVTENRKIEEQLRQSQKMEALGQLAGGVAHDFNNILQVIMGYAALLRADGVTEKQADNIREIMAASERAAELTSGLLSYSRKQVFKIEVIDLNQLLGTVEKFLRRILGEDITLIMERCHEALPTAIDKAHMQQVFINLASNARDAMPSGGTLSIRTERIEMDEEFVHAHGYGAVGQYALATVSDTGCGIPKVCLQKIFEPFYTTKGVGKGTGLGLSIVYGIIAQHSGFINCYSEPGTGTAFRIYIPLSQAEVQRPAVIDEPALTDATGVVVLLAEDDPGVRTVTGHILGMHGYDVIEAENGTRAVELFREHADRIGVVLIDALMPELNGAEALAAIREIRPTVKALFMSGYAREILSGRMLIPDDVGFINKPVLPARLINAIRAMTGGAADE